MTKSNHASWWKRVTFIGWKSCTLGIGLFLCHPLKNSIIFMPPWFIPSSKFLCHPFLCYHNFKMFMLTVLILPQIFLCQRKNRNWESISTFLTHFLHYPHFFMPPSRKLKSFCHLHFMPPWKSLCHSGVGIKNMRVALKKKPMT